jgi:tol-pal system protein YbgF
MRHARLPLALILLGAASVPAHAGLFDDDEARARIEQLRAQTNSRLENLEATQRNQLEISNQIEALRAELAKLRGQVEVLTFDLESAQKRQRDFYVDLDNRLRKLESSPAAEESKPGAAGGASPSAGASSAPADPAAETRDYESALNLFKAGKYKESAGAFTSFIKAYPGGNYLASAHYWAANSFYQLRDFGKAADHYLKVSNGWSNDPKAPDALLGLSNCQQETGNAKAARTTLESLVAKYPSSPAADIARQRLKKK